MSPKCLVIGSNGFVGRALLQEMERRGWSALGADLHSAPVSLDVLDPGSIQAALAQAEPDVIINLAGVFHGPDRLMHSVNCIGTLNLLEAVESSARPPAFIGIGSAAEYGRLHDEEMPVDEDRPCSPITAYGASKLSATLAVMAAAQRGLRAAVVRPFNIIGAGTPRQLLPGALVGRLAEAVREGRDSIAVGRTDTARDFVAVHDVARGLAQAVESEAWGQVYHFCSGRATPIADLIEMILALAPRRIEVAVDPDLVRPNDVLRVFGSCEKARAAGIFSPNTPLELAVREAWNEAQ